MGNYLFSRSVDPNPSNTNPITTTTTTTTPAPGTPNLYHDDNKFLASDNTCLDGEILPTPNLKVYSFADMKNATGNFNSSMLLGKGEFGTMYKGWLDENTLEPATPHSGMVVAIKKLNTESGWGFEQWQCEVNFLGRLSHPNLVKLLGCCRKDRELLLVYEYMQKGSLDSHLFQQKKSSIEQSKRVASIEPLSWEIRIKIAIGAARGLAFLHSSDNPIIHRDVKPSDILLDGNFNAKLSDFGTAEFGPSDGNSYVTTHVKGTFGYIDPEYFMTGHLYVKSDVYGFGVVLLEILTGLRVIDHNRPSGQINLVKWAKPLLTRKSKLKLLMDAHIEGQYSSKAALLVAQLALQCLESEPRRRPSMIEVLVVLEQIKSMEGGTKVSKKTIYQLKSMEDASGESGSSESDTPMTDGPSFSSSSMSTEKLYKAIQSEFALRISDHHDGGGGNAKRARPHLSTAETEISVKPMLREVPEVSVEETPTPLDQPMLSDNPELPSWETETTIDPMLIPVGEEMSSPQTISPEEEEKDLCILIAKDWEGMIRKVEILRRKKDFLHLILSYPMKPEADDGVSFQSLRGLFCRMNQTARDLQALLSDGNFDKHGNDLGDKEDFQAVENTLSKYDFHMVAYLPHADLKSDESCSRRIEVGLNRQTSGTFEAPDEMLTLAVESAIGQVSKCIEDGSLRKIGIFGSGGERVAKALIDMPVVIAKCSIKLCVSVSQHHSTKEVRQNIAAQVCRIQETDDISEGSLGVLLPQNFFLLLDCVDTEIDLHNLNLPDHGIVVVITRSQNVYATMDVDLAIRMEDHLLPWELFRRNVCSSLIDSSSAIQKLAVQLVKECHSHLLAIILLARALKEVSDIGVWEMALHELTSQPSEHLQGMSEVMVHVLNLIWDRKDIKTKHCINQFMLIQEDQRRDCVVSDWFSSGLLEKLAEGIGILYDLIDSFLVENVGEGSVRMREETQIVLQNCFIPHLPSLYLWPEGLVSTDTREDKKWDAVEIHLMDSELSELPENPKCPALKFLWLENNPDLMEIPDRFFNDMPLLQSVDLSYTSIKYLPHSISRLVSLRMFNLRGCDLLMELPPQIGALQNLEVFDLEGTEIMYLPEEMGELTSLECLRFSLCGHANRHRVTKQKGTTIPPKVLSKLSRLVSLSIDVNPDGEWWNADVKAILDELSSLKCLKTLDLYVPSVESLTLRWDSGKLMYPDLLRFRITVGHHPQRIISRLPHKVEELFKTWEKSTKCLKYINGEGTPTEISEALNHTSIFFLDRHWTIKMLSEFGNENMAELEYCLLVECNELQTIIDGECKYQLCVDKKPVFGRIHYLGIHYMKNLESIWKGQIDEGCLSNLRSLTLHICPNLTTVFTPDLLGNLHKLEELIVEDCPKIKSLVTQESYNLKSGHFLPSLRKISLLDLPELVTISGGLSIGHILETLVAYNCPKLESFYTMELNSVNLMIKGEKEWWDSLKWHESEWSNCAHPNFEELRRGEDLMDQLAKEIYS